MSFKVYKLCFEDWDLEELVFSASLLKIVAKKIGNGVYAAWKYNRIFYKGNRRDERVYYEIRSPTGSFIDCKKRGIHSEKEEYYHREPVPEREVCDRICDYGDMATYISGVNNIFTLNDLPLRSCYNLEYYEEKWNEYGKKYYYCHTRDAHTGEEVKLYSNCYLTQDIDKYRENYDERKTTLNFMITRRRMSRYGCMISSIFSEFRTDVE